jgi:hypothetical protein
MNEEHKQRLKSILSDNRYLTEFQRELALLILMEDVHQVGYEKGYDFGHEEALKYNW